MINGLGCIFRARSAVLKNSAGVLAYFGEFEQLFRRKMNAGYGLKVSARFG